MSFGFGVGDMLQVIALTKKVYDQFNHTTASVEYREFSQSVDLFRHALSECAKFIGDGGVLPRDHKRRLDSILQDAKTLMVELEEIFRRHKVTIDTRKRAGWFGRGILQSTRQCIKDFEIDSALLTFKLQLYTLALLLILRSVRIHHKPQQKTSLMAGNLTKSGRNEDSMPESHGTIATKMPDFQVTKLLLACTSAVGMIAMPVSRCPMGSQALDWSFQSECTGKVLPRGLATVGHLSVPISNMAFSLFTISFAISATLSYATLPTNRARIVFWLLAILGLCFCALITDIPEEFFLFFLPLCVSMSLAVAVLWQRLRRDRSLLNYLHLGYFTSCSSLISTIYGQKRQYILQTLDDHGCNWLVWISAALGVFLGSYNLSALGSISPSMVHLGLPIEMSSYERYMSYTLLTIPLVGQVVFGFLTDKFGRARFYGLELIVTIIGTIGILYSRTSTVYNTDSISPMPWLAVWSIVMNLGIEANCPLSAVVIAEWAPAKARTRMLGSLFLMQPLGQLAAVLVGSFVTTAHNRYENALCEDRSHGNCELYSDGISWWVIVVGLIPAFFTIALRFQIPESPRYYLDVMDGREDVIGEFNSREFSPVDGSQQQTSVLTSPETLELLPRKFSWQDVKQYFSVQGNWRYLLGTATCWLFMDLTSLGLSIGNAILSARSYMIHDFTEIAAHVDWEIQQSASVRSIYDFSGPVGARNNIMISISSLLGVIFFIAFADHLHRKQFIAWSAFGFALIACMIQILQLGPYGVGTVLLALGCFLFNCGANTFIFLIPAEIFPTRYRCTCHSISAAAGKAGLILAEIFFRYLSSHYSSATSSLIPIPTTLAFLSYVFAICACTLGLGSIVAWAWLPDVQNQHSRESKSLEELGEGLKRAKQDGQVIGFRNKLSGLLRRNRNASLRSVSEAWGENEKALNSNL